VTPAARLQAAIEILGGLATTGRPADRYLRDWFRARRFAGSKDRAAIAERVFAILRHRASLAWRMGNDSPRALAIASLLQDGLPATEVATLFSGGYGPEALSAEEQSSLARPKEEPPLAAACDFPAFLEPELSRAFGPGVASQMAAMNGRASVDLRVNTLKAERGSVLSELREAGFDADVCTCSPFGIRLPSGPGTAALQRTPLYQSGAFEFQDESAQIAALLCAPEPGQSVLDYAAGAGGKSLALAALMKNQGQILACDVRRGALQELEERAKRAGVDIIRTRTIDAKPLEGLFDVVLVDAPCSGSGTWRRQPELKWRLTPERLGELHAVQAQLLATAALNVRAGGALVYATCSILPSENEDRVSEFLERHPAFCIDSAEHRWDRAVGGPRPAGLGRTFQATPLVTGTDGFFVTRLIRATPMAGTSASV
jgi:16S rRNA (cytosine967-C5)-methyltransferase